MREGGWRVQREECRVVGGGDGVGGASGGDVGGESWWRAGCRGAVCSWPQCGSGPPTVRTGLMCAPARLSHPRTSPAHARALSHIAIIVVNIRKTLWNEGLNSVLLEKYLDYISKHRFKPAMFLGHVMWCVFSVSIKYVGPIMYCWCEKKNIYIYS